MNWNITYIILGVAGVVSLVLLRWILSLRTVVPTNMVHIAQTRNKSLPYGRGKEAGNVYYKFPDWIPFIGIVVTQFQESIFQINLKNYDAYDSARLPFMIDVSAFFKVANAETVAQRVSGFPELTSQLESILQGAVRRILATTSLEEIMQERSSLGDKFTSEVQAQIQEWGVESVKTIEFMDLRDANGSSVIANIMEKKKSLIESESRIEVALNRQAAETKEIEAGRIVQINKQEAERQVGVASAEKDRLVGVAKEISQQEILTQQKNTKERTMEVQRVNLVKQAEIDKDVAIVAAEQDKQQIQISSEAELFKANKNAEAIRVEGEANATAERLMLEAPVDAQIKLANQVGGNKEYQTYLITIKQIEVDGEVRKENAKALTAAKMQILVNSGDVQSGITKLTDVLSSKGGQAISGMMAGMDESSKNAIGGLLQNLLSKGKQTGLDNTQVSLD